jgi:hypothetical protein
MRRALNSPGASHPRRIAAALLAWAGLVLLGAFVAICMRTASVWPWTLVVHEDGKRTLIGTILYVEHATRELPLDILLGVAIGGCVFYAFPPDGGRGGATERVAGLAWMTGIVVAVILVGTALLDGVPVLVDNLFQKHTRSGAPLVWGSHWRYHLLERIALILASIGFAGMGAVFTGGERGTRGLTVAAGSIGMYGALTLVFSNGLSSLGEPFHDPQYLGHQARELFTHALVTVPAGWGGCLLLAQPPTGVAQPAKSRSERASRSAVVGATLVAGTLGILLGGYVCAAALRVDAVSHGQTPDLAMLIFPHFFEHSFTYLVVPTVARLAYEVAARRVGRRGATTRQTA